MTLRPVSSALLPRASADRPDATAGARPRPFADIVKPELSADAVRRRGPLPAQILPSATYAKPLPTSIKPLPAIIPAPVPVASNVKPVATAKVDPAADYPVPDAASDTYYPAADSSAVAKPRLSAKA